MTNTTYTYSGNYTVDSTDAPSNTITSIGAGDSFTISGSLQVGFNHTGSFNQSGGSVTAQASDDGTGFVLGTNAGSSGTYTMTGGTLSAGNAYVGRNGSGTMNHSAGTVSFGNPLYVGYSSQSTGTYNLSGTGSLSALYENIGTYGGSSGHFVQSGGTNSTQDLFLAQLAGGQGTYLLSAGVLSVAEHIDLDNGTFTQTGGSVTTSVLYIANADARAVGAYMMSGGTLTIQPRISNATFAVGTFGNGTFTQTGGTVTSTGTNFSDSLFLGFNPASSGTYNLDGGTLSVFGVRGRQGQGTFNFNGGTLQAQADNGSFVTALTTAQVRDGGAKIDTNGHNVTVSQTLVHSTVSGDNATDGGLTKLGGGTLTLTGTNTYTGGTFINGGTLAVSGDGTLGAAGGALGANGGTLDLGGQSFSVGAVTVAGGTVQNGTLTGTSYNGQSGAVSANLAGSIGLTKTTAGTLTLSGANTYTGGTFIDGGTLALGSSGALANTGNITFGGGTLQFSGDNATAYSGHIKNSTGAISVDTNGQESAVFFSFSGALDSSNSGGLTKLGEGTLYLFGANTYTGQTIVSQGTLAVPDGGIGAAGSTDNLVVNLGSGGAPTGTTPTAPSLTLNGDDTQVFFHNAFIGSTAAGSVNQTSGTFTTSNILYLGYSGTNATTGNGTYNLQGGTLNTRETQIGNGGTGTFNHSGGMQTVTTTLYLGLNNGTGTYNLSVNGVLQASAGVVGYTGTGVFNQTGGTANFGSGGLAVGSAAGSQGSYVLGTAAGGDAAILNASGPVYVGYSGTGTFNAQVNGLLQTGSNPLYLGYNAGSLGTFNSNSGELHVGGGSTIGYAGTGVFNSTGGYESVAGTLVLGHAAGSSGTYNLGGGGTLVAAQVGTQGGTSTFNFGDGKLIPTASRTDFLQGLTRANVRNGGMTVDTFGYNVTIAQPLLHSNVNGDNATDGGLTKFNAGILTLTGASTYNGGTRVQAGTLLVNSASGSGTGSGQVTVGNGAVLGGGGTIAGNVVALSGATVAPGTGTLASTARLTLGGTLTLQNNALLAIELGGATAGSGYDQVFAAVGFTLAGNLQVSLVNGFTPAVGQPFTILDNTNLFGGNSGAFANAPGGVYTTADGMQFAVAYATNFDGGFLANDVTLFYLGAVVPEPATWVWLLLGIGGLAVRHGRRRARPGQA